MPCSKVYSILKYCGITIWFYGHGTEVIPFLDKYHTMVFFQVPWYHGFIPNNYGNSVILWTLYYGNRLQWMFFGHALRLYQGFHRHTLEYSVNTIVITKYHVLRESNVEICFWTYFWGHISYTGPFICQNMKHMELCSEQTKSRGFSEYQWLYLPL